MCLEEFLIVLWKKNKWIKCSRWRSKLPPLVVWKSCALSLELFQLPYEFEFFSWFNLARIKKTRNCSKFLHIHSWQSDNFTVYIHCVQFFITQSLCSTYIWFPLGFQRWPLVPPHYLLYRCRYQHLACERFAIRARGPLGSCIQMVKVQTAN